LWFFRSEVDISSDESEEIIWMPMRTVERVQPYYKLYPTIQVCRHLQSKMPFLW